MRLPVPAPDALASSEALTRRIAAEIDTGGGHLIEDGLTGITNAMKQHARDKADELLAEITRALPAKPVDLAVIGPKVSIVAGSARFTLPTMPVEDYPPLPQMPSAPMKAKASNVANDSARNALIEEMGRMRGSAWGRVETMTAAAPVKAAETGRLQ